MVDWYRIARQREHIVRSAWEEVLSYEPTSSVQKARSRGLSSTARMRQFQQRRLLHTRPFSTGCDAEGCITLHRALTPNGYAARRRHHYNWERKCAASRGRQTQRKQARVAKCKPWQSPRSSLLRAPCYRTRHTDRQML